MTEVSRRPAVTVYCAGGCGINLGYELKQYRETVIGDDIYSEFNIRFADTSKQNFLGKDIDIQKEAYIFADAASDGSGQDPSKNLDMIQKTHRDLISKFAPSDINIVLFGMSGGSGFPIAAILARHLIAAGRPTILIGVGSVDTLRYAKNTKNAFGTLQAMAKATGRPFILNYFENIPNRVETEINETVIFNLANIALLLSGAADRIDSSDLANWLDYTRFNTQPATLTALHIALNDDPLQDGTNPFSCLSILKSEELAPRSDSMDFRKVGYMKNLPQHANSIHYYLDKPTIAANFQRITRIVTELEEKSKDREMDFDFGSDANNDGFVL